MKVASAAHNVALRDRVSTAEWQARLDLAACYRLIARFGFTDLIYNHVTLEVPGEPGAFLINPFGLFYSEITASSLHKIDLSGKVLLQGDAEFGVNRAGYVIHSAVHEARPDARCVIHTHTRWDVAVSAMKCGLLPLSQTALRFLGRIGYHSYEGPATDADEKARLVADLGENDVLLLHNHGSLVCGRTVAEAFHLMQRFQTACQVQVDVMAAGRDLILPSERARQRTAAMFSPRTGDKEVSVSGSLEWRALLRRLDREDPSYRE